MKLHNRIFSTLLAVILMLGALSGLSVIGVGAAEENSNNQNVDADELIENTYVNTVFKTPEEKLATMTPVDHMNNQYSRLYIDPVSGEVAVENLTTGEIMFSNPYDVASSQGSASTKKQILSQLVVQYVDNGTTKYLYSFEEAAMREQITVLNIKNGVRVEYTIGREESRKLVPRWIRSDRFDKFIKEPLDAAKEAGEISEFFHGKFLTYYTFQSVAEKSSKKAKEQLVMQYPCCEEMDIYVFATDASSVEVNWCEAYIKAYCEDYTFEEMDLDHEITGYIATDEQYPVFKMALEYSLDEKGALSVRLPCNGLRYDMAVYTLEYISVLPYMGAGNSLNAGLDYENYNFYPDGSGSLFDFEQLNTKSTTTVRGKVYGLDYAYHNISGVTYQKTIRYPIYGTVSAEYFHTFTYTTPEYIKGEDGKMVPTGKDINVTETVSNTVVGLDEIEEYVTSQKGTLLPGVTTTSYQRGFVAFIESGESLAEISTYHAGSLSDYNSMMNYFNPKPKDSYDIADSISVTSSSSWTVVSDRKYTGSILIRYQMLTDKAIGDEAIADAKADGKTFKYYDTSWLGMAEAYRDYLVSNGTLTKLTEEELEANIPLYLEVFGALETQQQIATIPVDVMTPLTTFENVNQMYTDLSDAGIKNINFKLTGFANGGMYYTVPAALKWEKAVGGANGFNQLIQDSKDAEAKGEHMGIFPDFDFAYLQVNELFDSTNLKKDAIKTIDNRYSSFRQYSATQQSYVSFFQLAIAPSRYSKFYTKLLEKYSQYDIKTMSVASLGTALNSDFDEDEPYNREDSKLHTVQAFEDLKSAGYSLMTEGANAYSWGYIDHIINVDLDSSRYIKSSASVPFIGAVLHGYVQFAGTPFNEEGDTDYAILRAIENGAGMYFILSYQNTQELKEDMFLSQYYSVRYDIWQEDVVEFYNELNGLLKDVQDKVIINHQFLTGDRVLDLDELEADLAEQLKKAEEEELKKQEELETAKGVAVADAWKTAESAARNIKAIIEEMAEINAEDIEAKATQLKNLLTNLPSWIALAYGEVEADPDGLEGETAKSSIETVKNQLNTIKSTTVSILKAYKTIEKKYAEILTVIEDVKAAKVTIQETTKLSAEVKEKYLQKIDIYLKDAEELLAPALEEVNRYLSYVQDDTSETSVVAIAMGAVSALDVVPEGFTQALDMKTLCGDSVFTAESLRNEAVIKDDETGEDGEDDGDTEENKYLVDNNQIVVVTYGDRNDETFEKTAYKSFILNYNNFAVRVTYKNKSYTIPSGGYVVIYD
ncbi:MAG: hypothetical protein IJZ80_10375 [Clostridia bacterium]|nr:hypothetical protein [Clostridia bacterium]